MNNSSLVVLLILFASSVTSAARRRSIVDLPVEVSVDDNLATASEFEDVKFESATNESIVESKSDDDVAGGECDSESISFEIITG
jgi:hypothetical protein